MTGKEQKELWLNIVKAVLGAAPQMCITCGHYDKGKCSRFDSVIPPDYAQDKNDCGSWKTMDVSLYGTNLEDIPF